LGSVSPAARSEQSFVSAQEYTAPKSTEFNPDDFTELLFGRNSSNSSNIGHVQLLREEKELVQGSLSEGNHEPAIRMLVPHGLINEDRDLEFIFDISKRTKRFNTYKKRMINLLYHLGAKTGCYGILYLRKYCLSF
jgi:hypothetical protein